MENINNQRYLRRGITKAAVAAGVSRQHIWLCYTGRRNPSPRVAEAIKKNVVAYVPIRLDEHTTRNGPSQEH